MRRRIPSPALDESYRIGVDQVDRGLDGLLRCLGDLVAVVESGLEGGLVGTAIDIFEGYARRQFLIEERMMVGSGYHDLDDHRSHHQYFMARVAHLKQEWMRKRRIPEENLSFFVNWVIAHITAIDRKFGEFASTVKRRDLLTEPSSTSLRPSEGRP